MPLSFAQFLRYLTDTDVMSAEDVRQFVEGLPEEARPRDGKQLAHELVRHKKLTAPQAQALYQGQGQSLIVGNYVILDKLGKGGMGVVFEAAHRRLQRVVALKVMAAAAMESPEAVKRFQREVRTAARLVYPNIVAAYDADEADGKHFLGMLAVVRLALVVVLAVGPWGRR